MEAKLVRDLPDEPGWQFEPKWDGFRALVFRDGDTVEIRHGIRLLHWRADKAPAQCVMEQLVHELRPAELATLGPGSGGSARPAGRIDRRER